MVLPVFRFHSHYNNWEYHPMPCSKYFLRLELKDGWQSFRVTGLAFLKACNIMGDLTSFCEGHELRVFCWTWLTLREVLGVCVVCWVWGWECVPGAHRVERDVPLGSCHWSCPCLAMVVLTDLSLWVGKSLVLVSWMIHFLGFVKWVLFGAHKEWVNSRHGCNMGITYIVGVINNTDRKAGVSWLALWPLTFSSSHVPPSHL